MKAAIRPVGSWVFVPAGDADAKPDEQTRITCRQLTQAERMGAWDNLNWTEQENPGTAAVVVTVIPRTFRLARELCRIAIVSIENFPPGAPKAWPVDGTDSEKDAYLDLIPDMEMLRIGQAIRNKAFVEDEIKNS